MGRKESEAAKQALPIELLKVPNWIKKRGQKVALLFEGHDATGKGGTIKRLMEHLNPRGARVVALKKPTETEHPRGTSRATSNACPPPAKWCSSIAPGTTGPALSS